MNCSFKEGPTTKAEYDFIQSAEQLVILLGHSNEEYVGYPFSSISTLQSTKEVWSRESFDWCFGKGMCCKQTHSESKYLAQMGKINYKSKLKLRHTQAET